jgi:predicted Zn-dependent peptidase
MARSTRRGDRALEFLRPVERQLANGLRIRLLPTPAVPALAYQTFFRVGSRDEYVGRTGISHLFEHLMFNGATRYGPKEFDRALEARGGSSNAYTSWDLTVYHEEVPPDALALVVDLESDRMGGLNLTAESLASEREVVKEERRLRVDDSVPGLVDELMESLIFRAHPYRWPVRQRYAPNQATIYVSGAFEVETALELIERAYGELPSGRVPSAPPTEEPLQQGERRAELRRPAQAPVVSIGFRAPRGTDRRSADLDAVQALLGMGEGSLLNRDLVFRRGLCTQISVDYSWRIDEGSFVVTAELPPGGNLERVEKEIRRHLQRLVEEGPERAHLERVKTQASVHWLRELATCSGRAHVLGTAEHLLGELAAARSLLSRVKGVTVATARSVASEVFAPGQACVVTVAG